MIKAKVTQGFCLWHKWITESDAGITQYQRCSRCGGRRILQGDTGDQPIDYGYLFHEQLLGLPERERGRRTVYMASDLVRTFRAMIKKFGDGPLTMIMDIGDRVQSSDTVVVIGLGHPFGTRYLISNSEGAGIFNRKSKHALDA